MGKRKEKSDKKILQELESLRQQVAEFGIMKRQYEWSEKRLYQEKEMAQNYLDIAGVIIVLIDKAGKVVLINKKGAEILGYSQREIVGKNWFSNFLPKVIRDGVKDIFSKVISGKEKFAEYYENPVLTKKGEERLISWHNTALRNDQGKIVASLSSGEDITQRKLIEERLEKLNKCFLSFGVDPKKNINKLVATCGETLGATCALYNRLENEDMLCVAGQWHVPADYKAIDKIKGHICHDVIRQKNNKVLFVRDLANTIYAKTDPNVDKYKLKTYVGAAVKLGNVFLGSLCVVYQSDFIPTKADKNLIKIIAAAIGVEEERKHTYEAEQQNLELYRALIKASPDGVAFIDLDGNFVMVNQQGAKLHGFSAKEEMIGKNVLDFIPDQKKKEIKNSFAKLQKTGKIINLEAKFFKKDRSLFIGALSCSLLKDTGGNPKAFVGTLRDITSSKNAAQILKDSEERYRIFFEQAPDSILLIDAEDGRFVEFNDKACQNLGYTRKEFAELKISDIESVESVQEVRKHIDNIIKQGGDIFETKQRTKNGDLRDILVNTRLITIKGRKFVHGIWRDVTEQKKAEEELSITKFVFDNMADAAFWIAVDGGISYVNSAACNLLGYSYKELSAMKVFDIDANFTPETWPGRWKVMKKDKIGKTETHFITKEGRRFPVEINGKYMKYDGQEYVCAIARDITERWRIAEALRRAEEEKTGILDSLPEMVAYYGKDMRILWANKAAGASSSLSPVELVGSRCYDVWHKRKIPCEDCPVVKVFKTGGCHQAEIALSDGRVWFVRAHPIKDLEGNASGVVEVISDITVKKRTEQECRQSLDKSRRILEETVIALAATAERRDPYTAGHQRRVAHLACAIAKEMNLDEDKIEGIRMASIIHDVGKVYVPAEILSKPSKLSDLEFSIIKTHPQIGYDILKPVEFPWPIATIVLQHHEKINGSGYPKGISGKDILIEAKILTVADVVEAMASHRPYRAALGMEKALAEIRKNRGIFYDQQVVDSCINVFKKKQFKFE